MSVTGIIAEYNPFHTGHAWQIAEARRRCGPTPVIVAMSGSFVQRGEPAIFDKWLRAELAVLGGADLVLELPFTFSCRSAETFAQGGVRLLAATGLVSTLAFSAETPDLSWLQQAARQKNTPQTQERLQNALQKGLSYGAALGAALDQNATTASALALPNNILALEYLSALAKYAPALQSLALPRQGSGYHQGDLPASGYASATALRQQLLTTASQELSSFFPPAVWQRLLSLPTQPVTLRSLELPLLQQLRSSYANELALLPDMEPGLEWRLLQCARTSRTAEELLTKLKTKRYARTRLQRLLIYSLLRFPAAIAKQASLDGPAYLRVLAFNATGRTLLQQMKKTATLPVITRGAALSRSKSLQMAPLPSSSPLASWQWDVRATDLHAFASGQASGLDFLRSPVYVPESSS